MNNISQQDITAVVLAGGEARRMGGNDKGLLQLNGKAMIAHILERLEPQVGKLMINANRNEDEYARFNYPVIKDRVTGFCGPLAGIASALEHCDSPYLLSVPCDSPYIPDDLAARFAAALTDKQADIAVANNGERLQPVFNLLNTGLLESLLAYLDSGERKIDRWFKQHQFVEVDFSDAPRAFININTPEELEQAEQDLRTVST